MKSMFCKNSQEGDREVLDGVRLKTLVRGERTLLAQFHLKHGSRLPLHRHPYEQTGYLVSGRIRLIIDGRECEAGPGDGWSIPANVEHCAEILADSVAIEVFSPVREDYLPAAGEEV
jgi:quercetin dioxygenase-like cupin family protein